MAEAILRRLLFERPDASQWHIESAGTWADYGSRAAKYSQVAMHNMGMDISLHQSQPVSGELLGRFDLILTMEGQHKEGLCLQWEKYKDRIFMLSEMTGVVEDIHDPIGGTLEDYEETAQKLEQLLSDGLDQIIRLARMHQAQLSEGS